VTQGDRDPFRVTPSGVIRHDEEKKYSTDERQKGTRGGKSSVQIKFGPKRDASPWCGQAAEMGE